MNDNVNDVGLPFLYDFNTQHKRIFWDEKKEETNFVGRVLYAKGHKKIGTRLQECGNQLVFAIDEEGNKILKEAFFCHARICPMCQFRRSRKFVAQMIPVLDEIISSEENYKFLFLTLTRRNCAAHDLNKCIKEMAAAWNLLRASSKFRSQVFGYIRTVEVTYNKKSKTYHPHFHVVLVVNDSYFSKSNTQYMSHSWLLSKWEKYLGDDHAGVHISSVKSRSDKNFIKVILEVAKYSYKDDFLLTKSLSLDEKSEVIENLYKQLHGIKMVQMGGIIQKVHKRLHNNDDIDDGDLIHATAQNKKHVQDLPTETYIFAYWLKPGIYIKSDELPQRGSTLT